MIRKLPDLVHQANMAGAPALAFPSEPVRQAPDNAMTPADFARHWRAAEASGNSAKTAMLVDLCAHQSHDFLDAVIVILGGIK